MGWRSRFSGCPRSLPVSYGCPCRMRAEVLRGWRRQAFGKYNVTVKDSKGVQVGDRNIQVNG